MSSVPSPAPRDAAHWDGVLDNAVLNKLRELDPSGKGGLVQRVVGTYGKSLARLLGEFRVARAGGDQQALRSVAHTLKSSSASVGALTLSALCAEVERRVRDGEGAGIEPDLAALEAEAARVLAALEGASVS